MKKIPIQIPEDCKAVGCLYESDDHRDLGEDMMDISLPHGLLLSVGWYPEGDKSGSYVVTLTKLWSFVEGPFRSTDPHETAKHICSLIKNFNEPAGRAGGPVTWA